MLLLLYGLGNPQLKARELSFPVVQIEPLSENPTDLRTHNRQIAQVVNRINRGKIGAVYYNFTLTASATSTVLSDSRLGMASVLYFDPETTNAAEELATGTMYVATSGRTKGAFTVSHSNSTETDRTFRVLIIG